MIKAPAMTCDDDKVGCWDDPPPTTALRPSVTLDKGDDFDPPWPEYLALAGLLLAGALCLFDGLARLFST